VASLSYAGLTVRVTADTRALTTEVSAASKEAGAAAGSTIGKQVSTGIGGAAKTAGKALGAVGVVAGAAMGGFLVSAVKAGVAYNVLYQKSTKAFQSVLGSQKAASDMMASITAFAKTSPFPRQTFIAATQQMLGFGVASKNVIPILSAVQDAVAATGGNADDLSGIVTVLAKVQSQGKFTARTLNEMGTRGIDAAQLIGKGMDMTAAQVRKSITSGTLDSQKALTVLVQQMQIKYAGAAAGLKTTWVGTKQTIQAAMRDIGSAIVEPFISKEGGGLAIEWGNKLGVVLKALEPAVTPLTNALMQSLAPAIAWVNKGINDLLDATLNFANNGVDPAVAALKRFGAPALAVSAALSALAGGTLLAQLPLIGPIVSGLIGPFLSLGKAIGKLTAGTLLQLVPGLGELAGVAPEAAAALGGLSAPVAALVGAVALVVAASPKLRAALVGFGTGVVQALAPVFAAVVYGAKQVIPPIMAVAKIIGDDLAPIIAQLTPLLAPLGLAVGTVLAVGFTELSFAMKLAMPVTTAVINALSALAEMVLAVAVPAITILLGAVNGVVPTFEATATAVAAAAQATYHAILTAYDASNAVISSVMTAVVGAVSAAWSAVTGATTRATSAVTGAVSAAFAAVVGAASVSWAAVSRVVSSAWASVSGVTTRTLTAIRNAVASAFGAVASIASSTWGRVVSVVSGVLSTLRGVVAAGAAGAVGALRSAWAGIAGAAAALWSGVGGAIARALSGLAGVAYSAGVAAVDGLKNGMSAALGGILSWINSHILGPVRSALSTVTGGLIRSAPAPVTPAPVGPTSRVQAGRLAGTIAMARGGIVREPVTGLGTRTGRRYLIGEAGPERVSPLLPGGLTADERAMLSALGGGRGATAINVYPRESQSETQVAAAVDKEWAWAAAGGGSR
jgi:tape measure domain-containing protein